MSKLHLVPFLLVVAFLGLVVFGAALPSANSVMAEDGKDGKDGGDDEGGPGEFYEDETTFSGAEVTKAIDKGVAWLRKKQDRNGSWGGMKGNAVYGGGQQAAPESLFAGPTALAVYTLLKCKQPLKDPVIKKGFDYLAKEHKRPDTSYEAAMMLLAVTATADQAKMTKTSKKVPPPKLSGKYLTWASKLVDQLVEKRRARGWRYNRDGQEPAAGGPEDLSSTQLSSLALFAAHRMGVKVKDKVWEDILGFSLDQQEADGPEVSYQDPIDPKSTRTAHARGFAYIKDQPDPDEGKATGGMTACGLANVEMARFVLSDGGKDRDKWNQRPDADRVQTAIFDGIAWLEKNWSPFENPHKRSNNIYHVYWLYALERSMDLLDLKLVGSHNWYNEMGQELLNRQASDGHWDTKTSLTPSDTLDTCFALLFLKRATKGSIPFGSVTGGSEDAPADNR